jgi:hypothetical protein
VQGSASFILTLNGSYFDQSSVVMFGGAPLPTVFSNETGQITAR